MVAVHDNGEPGADDTWRIRIWYCGDSATALAKTKEEFANVGACEATLVFDTNYVASNVAGSASYRSTYPLPNIFEPPSDAERWRFNGTNVGELHANGGGNIQIHLAHQPSKALQFALEQGAACECDKQPYLGDGNGFVTGGGWIILGAGAYLSSYTGSLDNMKANFGFNAKFIGGIPRGSTNFVVHGPQGNFYHFHSDNARDEYNELEVVCADEPYGAAANTVYARWWGNGLVSTAVSTGDAPTNTFVSGYRFYVAVQDNGEPGTIDKFRIRIFNKDRQGDPSTVWFDSNYELPPIFANDPEVKCIGQCVFVPSFEGNFLGGTDESANGGGNIQTHCKGGPSR